MRRCVLSVGYLGFIPGAPGTYASVLALGIYLAGTHLGAPGWVWAASAGFAAVVLVALGVPTDAKTGSTDPGWCVLDEVAGAFVAVIGQPLQSPVLTAVGALLFFRFFDILKPPPVNLLERLKGRWGVLADDLAAGGLANLCLWVLRMVLDWF